MVRRSGTVPGPPDAVWRLVTDPDRLPEWWPGVQRVEEATPEAWTKVLVSSRGKTVRADYTRLEAQRPRRLLWRHEVEESPFERLLEESLTEIELEPEGPGSTRVALTTRMRLRGWARFGSLQMRVAAARHLRKALAGLERAMGG